MSFSVCLLDYSNSYHYDEFIYNRFDLQKRSFVGVVCCRRSNGESVYVQYTFENKTIILGVWDMPLYRKEIKTILKHLLKKYEEFECVRMDFINYKIGHYVKKNHFVLTLPDNQSAFERIVKKNHSREKSKMNKLSNILGAYRFVDYNALNCPTEISEFYFVNKKSTKGIEYNFGFNEYIKRYYVTDVYASFYGDTLVSVLLSCEQSNKVYLENLTYDPTYSKYSPGTRIYIDFLSTLISKGLYYVDLGGGSYGYKKYFNSTSSIQYNCCYYRKVIKNLYLNLRKTIKQILWRK